MTDLGTRVSPIAPDCGTGGRKIRVLLADDHALVRQGLSVLLSGTGDLEVAGEASNGREAVDRARELVPDVILMDFSMPEMDGLEATKLIHSSQPGIRIVGLSMYDAGDRAAAMLEAGASEYVPKSGGTDLLLAAIRRH